MNETQKMSSITKSFGEFTVSYNGSTSHLDFEEKWERDSLLA